MEKIIVYHRSSHHANHSGYSALINYLENVVQLPTGSYELPDRVKKSISKNTNQIYGAYHSDSVQKDFDLLLHLLSNKNKDRVVHYLNSERDVRLVTKLTPLYTKTKTCASFHYPPSLLPKANQDVKYLRKLNGAIAVGINQVDFIKNWLNMDSVEFIPHGVATHFFVPDAAVKKHESLLFVGQHLRDFDALNYAIPRLLEKKPNLQINVVLRKDFAKHVVVQKGVTVFSGIDDVQLRNLYCQSSLLFLPLKDATACNSILEALSCGLPIVSTEIDGNKGYVKNDSGVLVPSNDYLMLIDQTLALLDDPGKLHQMSINARKVATEFDWEQVAVRVAKFYDSLIQK